jgi:hypothetical protein
MQRRALPARVWSNPAYLIETKIRCYISAKDATS